MGIYNPTYGIFGWIVCYGVTRPLLWFFFSLKPFTYVETHNTICVSVIWGRDGVEWGGVGVGGVITFMSN